MPISLYAATVPSKLQVLGAGKGWLEGTQAKLGYGGPYPNSSWQQPQQEHGGPMPDFIWPALVKPDVPAAAALGVAIDGSAESWPAAKTEPVPRTWGSTPSIWRPIRSSTARSGPKILMPTGVLMPVASMSSRLRIGIDHMLTTPGVRTVRFISEMMES